MLFILAFKVAFLNDFSKVGMVFHEENAKITKNAKQSLLKMGASFVVPRSMLSNFQTPIVVIRVMRELRRTVTCLAGLRQFTLELLVEKVLASAPVPLSPGDAFRRVFEGLAGGLLLPDSPGKV